MVGIRHSATHAKAFLTRLARNTRGNTLAIMAIALIPLAGMVGGGVDISRMYIVKTRLQHACDAGALAGRKAMGGGTWAQTVNSVANYPRVQAEKFFDVNYDKTAYGVDPVTVTKTFTESAGKVNGTASATVPMTLMRIFGKSDERLTVVCDAEMRLPNTDVMFVLDTTGSMDYCPNGSNSCNGNSSSRIAGLRKAVKCFYQIVARLDVPDVNCNSPDPEPSGGTGTQVQIRFGFVPYSTNVNVGKLLNPGWFADTARYQSRQQNGTGWTDWAFDEYLAKTNGNCVAPANTSTRQFTAGATGYGGNYACQVNERHIGPMWVYDQHDVNVGLLKSGTSWNPNYNFLWPVNDDGSNRTVTWDGCIEERQTAVTTDYDPIPSTANDLRIDLAPSAGDTTTLWKPALRDVVFTRRDSNNNWSTTPTTTTRLYGNEAGYSCPTEARRLQSWTNPTEFQNYVNSLDPNGNTYHDIGMIWGARLMSPTGIFAADNATAANGGQIERHLIFMTDGDTNAQVSDYAAYGVPFYDHRQTGANPTKAQLDEQVNLRFLAICNWLTEDAGITVWVVNFGEGQSQATKDRLRSCASSDNLFFDAPTSAELQTAFKSIAEQISQLRLTR
jgi:hypothetical protein